MKIELLGGLEKNELEKRIKQIATAGKLSRFKGNVFEAFNSCNEFEKNLSLIKRIISMGHKSIIEHDYFVIAFCDVTPIAEQVLIGNRLASFTIKSRREVDFSNAGYYVPDFRDNNGNIHIDNINLKNKYCTHIQYLFDTYSKLLQLGIDIEDARFILPYSFHSNIIMGLNARQLEKLALSLLYGTLSKYSELKNIGDKLLEIIEQNIPYIAHSIKYNKYSNSTLFEYFDKNISKPNIKILDNVQMVNYTKNPDDTIILSYIMYHYQCDTNQANDILNQLEAQDKNIKEKIIDSILHSDEQRELEQVSFTFQIPTTLSILTHISRHRMQTLLIPEFIPIWNLHNYYTPTSLQGKSLDVYINAVNTNIKVFNEFKEYNICEQDLIYFYLGCQMCNILANINGRSAQWICKLRTCNKTQLETRKIYKQVANSIKQVAPLFGKGLGPTCITNKICNEGKESCGLIDKILENQK